jgi:hypothetical protein
VLLNGVIIASLVRSGDTDSATWTAELLVDLPPGERPAPFTQMEHTFSSLEQARQWLGDAEIRDADLHGQIYGPSSMLIHPGKRTPLTRGRQEDWDAAREAYLLEHAPGLKEHYAAQRRAFDQIEADAQARHPDPTPDNITAAVAAEAALPYRKRTEAQLRRNFEPLSAHLPQDIRSRRKRFVQREQRAWNRANPTPLSDDMQRALTAEFVKTYARAARA